MQFCQSYVPVPAHWCLPQSDDVPIADMAAQIAAFALAEAGAEAAEQTAPVPLTVPAGSSGEPKAAAAASSIGTEGAPAAEPAAASTGGGAGEGEGAAQQLPVHLRLHAAASAWQPPATLAEQLRLVLGASTGEAKSELDMLSQAAGEARLAAYYVSSRRCLKPARTAGAARPVPAWRYPVHLRGPRGAATRAAY